MSKKRYFINMYELLLLSKHGWHVRYQITFLQSAVISTNIHSGKIHHFNRVFWNINYLEQTINTIVQVCAVLYLSEYTLFYFKRWAFFQALTSIQSEFYTPQPGWNAILPEFCLFQRTAPPALRLFSLEIFSVQANPYPS